MTDDIRDEARAVLADTDGLDRPLLAWALGVTGIYQASTIAFYLSTRSPADLCQSEYEAASVDGGRWFDGVDYVVRSRALQLNDPILVPVP